jgi:hypothetical protein
MQSQGPLLAQSGPMADIQFSFSSHIDRIATRLIKNQKHFKVFFYNPQNSGDLFACSSCVGLDAGPNPTHAHKISNQRKLLQVDLFG